MKIKIFCLFITFFSSYVSIAKTDTWIDEDGETLVKIDSRIVSIQSLNSFYYFDKIFTNIRQNNTKIKLCLGFNQNTLPKDCTNYIEAEYFFYNKGKNRTINIDMYSSPLLLKAFEDYLKSGKTMKISIDDNDLYAAYILNKKYILTEKSIKIIKLPN